jgi:hypothetical protein
MPPPGEEVFDEPVIPLAPRLPEELRSEFVRGVQPLTPTPEAWAPIRAHSSMPAAPSSYAAPPSHPGPSHAAPSYPGPPFASQSYAGPSPAPAYASQSYAGPSPASAAPPYFHAQASYPQAHAAPHYVPGQLHSAPAPAYASGPYARLAPHELANRALAAPVAALPSQASKVGRFAWFVAGAAFGITFAFFATGFFSGARSVDLHAAAPPPAATQVAPAVASAAVAPPALVAPPVAQALVAPPVAQAPVAPPVAQASAPPAVTGTFASPGLLPPANTASHAPAQPQRAAMRTAPARRAFAPAQPSGPRPLPGSGETEAPAAPSGGGASMGDLLGAGLNP